MLRWDLAEARKIAEEQRQFPREPCARHVLRARAACALSVLLFSLRAPTAPLRYPPPSRDLRVFDDESSGDCESVCSDDGERRAALPCSARFAQLARASR
jgi:hypothetical protein